MPKIGLVLMRSDLFECEPERPGGDAGRTEEAAAVAERSVKDLIEADARELVAGLGQRFQILGPWKVYSPESLEDCQQGLRKSDPDLIVLAYQTAASDAHLVPLVEAAGGRPLVVWCYLPWRRLPRPAAFSDVVRGSGPVGAFAALGTLKNLNAPFQFVFGAVDDPRLTRELSMLGRAAVLRRALRQARIGLIPSRNERMQGLVVDEFRLRADLGPTVQYISVAEFKRVVDSLSKVRVESYINLVRERFPIIDVSDATLARAAQAALGLAHLAVEYRLDVLAVNDRSPELQRVFEMRPALYPDLLEPLPALFQPEGDLGAATANFILNRLTGSPTMFLELWFWDEAKNYWLAGHHGLQNPAMAEDGQVSICRDFDICRPPGTEGAQFQFLARSARVTIFQLRATPAGWQAIAASGMCLPGQPWVEGYPHVNLRLDAPIDHFLRRVAEVGATQHWVMAYGSVLSEIEVFCKMMGIPVEVIG